MRKSVPLCKSVRLLSLNGAPPPVYPFYHVLRVGMKVGNCRVAFVSPPGACLAVPGTKFTVEEDVKIRTEELEHNVCVELEFSSGAREYYVYPKKVWRTLESRFIKPLSQGEPPKEQGAILYGAPGVGKTSAVMILSNALGLHAVHIEPDSILSKWVGESERNIRKKLDEAEALEPSIVVFDDAEWLLRARHLAGTTQDAPAYLAMLSIVFRKLQEWHRKRKRVIAITTTNVSIEKLDPALMRSGRMGRPIFVPLPDYEAVYTLMVKLGVKPEVAEKWAVKVVNAGLPMSDVVTISKDLISGQKPSVEPIKGRGYVRAIPPTDLTYDTLRKMKDVCGQRRLCRMLDGKTRLWIKDPYTMSVPIAVAVSGIVCSKPTVILNDPRYIDEAIATAEASMGVLIVNTDLIPNIDEVCKLVSALANTAVIFAGDRAPSIPVLSASSISIVGGEAVALEVIARYYGVKVSENNVREVMRLPEEKRKRIMKYMPYVIPKEGEVSLNEVRETLMPYG